MKPIVTIPNEVLISPAKTIVNFDKKLATLIKEMTITLKATRRPKGVGLAAPQVGEPYRVFITKPSAKSEIRAFINPEIIAKSTETNEVEKTQDPDDKKLEGCLSIPDIWGHIVRPESVTIRYQDVEGTIHEELITGFLATIVQHETDHTNGILFTQRVIEQHQKIYRSTIDKEGKEILDEITI